MIVLLGSLALAAAATPQASPIEFIDAGRFGRCAERVELTSAPAAVARYSRLADLPDAAMEKPLTRVVRYRASCAVAPVIVRYDVSRYP